MMARRKTAFTLALALSAAPVGCARCSSPEVRDASTSAADAGSAGHEAPTGPDVLGEIIGAARFSAAPSTLTIPGIARGDRFVAVFAAAQPGVTHGPGDHGDTFEIACYLGRTRLWPVPRPELSDAVVLVGKDPGGDLGELPVWCARRALVVGAQDGPAAEALDAAYRAAVARQAPARWLRGPDGRGPAPASVEVPPWRPGDPMQDPIGQWLARLREKTP